jgi:monolysocardiolipin acyltransferase
MPSQEMTMVGVSAYRQLLRKMRTAGGAAPTEDSAAALQQAKQRVMLRLTSARADRVQRDPRRAFARMRDQVARLREVKDSAKDSIKELGSARAARLRSAYDSLKQRSLRAVGARGGRDDVEVLGTNGPLRMLVLGSVAAASKLFMQGLSTTTVEGGAVLTAAQARPPGQPLITVSNHVAAMDDPLLLAALTPIRNVFEAGGMRWSLCATDRCFKGPLMAAFFRAGQVLPVERGKGLDQPGMRAAENRLAAGDWVHIFPEGTRSPNGSAMGPLRSGVGRLVAACESPPLVVPIVHAGMEAVMPRGRSLPVPGQQVRVLVGDPIPVDDLLAAADAQAWPDARLYRAVTARISNSMAALKARLDGVPVPAVAAAVLDDQQMLPMIEDELDAGSHSWAGSLRQAAGLPSVSSQAQDAAAAAAAAGGSVPASLPGTVLAGLPASLRALLLASPLDGVATSGGGGAGRRSVGAEWQSLAGPAAAYAQERVRHMAALLAQAGRGPQPALGL